MVGFVAALFVAHLCQWQAADDRLLLRNLAQMQIYFGMQFNFRRLAYLYFTRKTNLWGPCHN